MRTAGPTFKHIKAQVDAIRKKRPDERVIGVHSPERWTGDRTIDGGEPYHIYQCDSPLAMRLALRDEVESSATKVLITNLEERDLSTDILVRLAKRRLFSIDAWEIVKTLFQARDVDPTIRRHSWIADTLVDLAPPEGYPPVRAGFLDAESAWSVILNRKIGLAADGIDLNAILKWSIDPDSVSRFTRCADTVREAIIQWLESSAGPVAGAVLRTIARLERPDAIPLGLATGVIFHPDAEQLLRKTAGRFEERYLAGSSPPPGLIARWSAGASEVVRLQVTDARLRRELLDRADEILRDLQANEFAYLSDTSPAGFNQRLAKLGNQLQDLLRRRAYQSLDPIYTGLASVRQHELAVRESQRLERIEMASRLFRWLAARSLEDSAPPQSFASAAHEQLRDGGYVDWARLALRAGDEVQELSTAYALLSEIVTQQREQQARDFARLLQGWTAAGSESGDVLCIEDLLDRIVTPLASKANVLVVVVDGMSVGVCRQLLDNLTRHEWFSICKEGRLYNPPAIATIPSVTEASRTSLLSGRLQLGKAADEKSGFADHAALLAASRNGYPPVLFHKSSFKISVDAALPTEIRNEIDSPERKVVGVVLNAVDDHLLKGDQMTVQWSHDVIRGFSALLSHAKSSDRIVVLVSDHGHVLECTTQSRPAGVDESGERWRSDDDQPKADEFHVQGRRVLTEHHSLIAPWTEHVRYSVKKHGYHGGLNPQEMIVPVVVLSPSENLPVGWSEIGVEAPAWWEEPSRAIVEPVVQPRPLKPVKAGRPATLFDHVEEPQRSKAEEKIPGWVRELLSSAVFGQQKKLAGRMFPNEELVVRLLTVLESRGGKMTSTALARALDYPPLRLPGLLAVVQRVFNVDGYAVLGRDHASDTIELNRDLLLRQFDLG